MPEKSRGYGPLLISICLAAAIIAVYWPVHNYEFVRYDDSDYVTANRHIQSGFNFKDIRWAFTTGYANNWHPVTWLSLMLDYQFYKDRADGYHITNVLFHIANTIILFYLLIRVTSALWPSAFVAAVFALHPLHVESVAWIAERKDVLSTFFWFLTMLAYANYAKTLKMKWYLASFVLFAFGLMSKPMLVTVPFVLLLFDYWPIGRKITWRLLIEKIPFFVCSAFSCVVTYYVQREGGAMSFYLGRIMLGTRLNNAVVSYITYIIKMFWPVRLAVLYPYPSSGVPIAKVVICGLLLVLLSVCFIYLGRRHKFLTVGWLWYLGTLFPVIGVVQVGAQAIADRYTYVPLTGLFIIIAWGAKEFMLLRRYKILKPLTVIALIFLAVLSRSQLKYWQNSLSLFEHTLQVTQNNCLILDNLAGALLEAGRCEEAINVLKKSREIKPDSAMVNNNLGCALRQAGRIEQAIESFEFAVKCDPNLGQAYYNLAACLKMQGKAQEAVSCLKQACKIDPDNIDYCVKMGMILAEMQKFDEAIEFFNRVIKLEPNNVVAHGHRSLALAASGKIDEAIKDIHFVLKANPNDVMMYRNLGIFLEQKGDAAGAIEAYRNALRIEPYNENLRQLFEEALKSKTVP